MMRQALLVFRRPTVWTTVTTVTRTLPFMGHYVPEISYKCVLFIPTLYILELEFRDSK